jgi:hypothetical protein
MVERTCMQCRFFTPAPTWVKPPTWGYCTRPLDQAGLQGVQTARPVFVWSDNRCEDFECGAQFVPHV